ncbi:hypothetical protein [Paraburkholderia phenoliruptrix]|uniref:hypothetical protein n=1 Tax=Paraburkholderia phenoliruptrix TaxID=252970 RepID=UPI001C6E5499|nr:hypothetical protein [Paraburkholderia phenoliruptrix]MBW9107805.1 hypothetical protein [Paraburkholderia phenoliruptrix]MBW9133023.1 hypothetical protein [Paraburkholderia ginsengiterrae]
MKPVTADMLRAHLLVASFTALVADVFACVIVAVAPRTQHLLVSSGFRLAALVMMAGGVIVARQMGQTAFKLAVAHRYAIGAGIHAQPVRVASGCPRRWLVILHLRLAGKPFVVNEH